MEIYLLIRLRLIGTWVIWLSHLTHTSSMMNHYSREGQKEFFDSIINTPEPLLLREIEINGFVSKNFLRVVSQLFFRLFIRSWFSCFQWMQSHAKNWKWRIPHGNRVSDNKPATIQTSSRHGKCMYRCNWSTLWSHWSTSKRS